MDQPRTQGGTRRDSASVRARERELFGLMKRAAVSVYLRYEQAQGEVHVMPNRVAVEQHSILECPENRLNNRSVGRFAWCNLPRQAPTVQRQPV